MQKEGTVLSSLHGTVAGGAFAKLAVMFVAFVAMIATSLALTVGTAAAEEEYVPEGGVEEGVEPVNGEDDGTNLNGILDPAAYGIVFEYNASLDDTQPASSRNAVKYVVDVIDQAGNEVALPEGSVVPQTISLDQKSTVNVALSYITIPGATYESSYFWWGGTYQGDKTAVSTFLNVMYKSARGYDSYLAFASPDSWGEDYILYPGWYAYNPTGTLHIVYRMTVTPELSVTDYYGSFDGLYHTGTVEVSAGVAEYSTDGVTWTTDVPDISDAGSATYYVRANYAGVCSDVQTLTLTVVPRDVTVNVAGVDWTVTYDGTKHMVDGWNVKSFEVAEVEGQATPEFSENYVKFVSTVAYAEGTDAGTYPMQLTENDFWCDNNNFNATFVVTDGYLLIQPREVTVNLEGIEWTVSYDGTEHMVSGWNVTSYEVAPVEEQATPEFDESSIKCGAIVAFAKGTDAGTYPMELTSEDFYCDDANFVATINWTDGALIIEPRNASVTIKGNTAEYTYDGTEHFAEGWVATDVVIEEVEEQATPDDFDAASVKCQTTHAAKGTNAGYYSMDLSADEFLYEDPNYNVTFTVEDGGLTIDALSGVVVTIKGNTAEYVYDGKAHTVEGYTATYSTPVFTDKDFYLSGTAQATGTEIGTYAMGLKADQFSVASKNFYDVKFVVTDGQLSIVRESLPKTGDDTNTVLPVAAGVAGACAVAAAAVMLVRRQREN